MVFGTIGYLPCKNIAVRANREDKEISIGDYLLLLDWTARQAVDGKPGATPATALPIFERLSLHPQVGCQLVSQFGRLFYNVAGVPQTIHATASRVSQQRDNVRRQTRQLFSPSEPGSCA